MHTRWPWLALILLVVGLPACHREKTSSTIAQAKTSPTILPPITPVKIFNDQPRRDEQGDIIDAHDGCLQFFNGRFYLYGTAYGTNDGYGTANRYRVYSSPDLSQWKFEANLLTNQPVGVYYRPYVVFNTDTSKYVLWYNWYSKGWAGQEGVAVSDSPVGPFTIVTTNVFRRSPQIKPGDGSLFIDDDGQGYYIFTTVSDNYCARVIRLTPDYLDITRQQSEVLACGVESPLLFRRKNIYNALCGSLCAFCPQGSKIQTYTGPSPLGPFTPQSQINNLPTQNSPIVAGQETWVAKIPSRPETVYIWLADLWGQSTDGTRGHDFQFWSPPLEFDTNNDILPLRPMAGWFFGPGDKN
jgi:hypothetical protein